MKTILLALTTLIVSNIFAQDLSVIYDIKILKAPKEVKKVVKKMPDSKLTMRFSGKKTYSYITILGVFNQTVVFDEETGKGFVLMDIANTKIMVKLNKEQLEEFNKGKDSQPVVQEIKGSKKILGYDCKKIEMEFSNGQSYIGYITEEIKKKHENFQFLNGFPLEYQTVTNEMELSLTASAVDQDTKIKSTLFEAPTSGYQEISFEDLMKSRKK